MIRSISAILAAGLLTLGCAGCGDSDTPTNQLPDFVVEASMVKTYYDGQSDDLLTAGLGTVGFTEAAVPSHADPAAPTAAELRRKAIHSSYRGLTDNSSGGGFGRLFGPTVDLDGNVVAGTGAIAGWEYLAYGDDGSGNGMVTMMVQIPDSFDADIPCIITAPSSGSRGVYGAIGTSGEWGLKRGCAVTYTDQGKGTGFHDLQRNKVRGMRGEMLDAGDSAANFTARLTSAERDQFNLATPDRYAIKHVHSEQNPEQHWGRFVLQSIEFAFYVLNEHIHGDPEGKADTPQRITADNTVVIAAGVSNGGSAILKAIEQDGQGLIDAGVASEPNVHPPGGGDFVIAAGNATLDNTVHSKSFIDFYTFLNLYQPCASLAASNQEAPLLSLLDPAVNRARCQSLADNGLLDATELDAQAEEAQQRINNYGFDVSQNLLQPSHQLFHAAHAIAVGYANAFGRYRVTDNLCGFSYAATDMTTGQPIALAAEADADLFATSSGIPPTGGLSIVYNDSQGGAIDYTRGVSPNTGRADASFDGMLCLRQKALQDSRINEGSEAIEHTGNLRGVPTIMVIGRADAIIPVNHSVRPYYAANQMVEGANSKLRYYEVLNAHHLDTLNALSGFDERYVPIHNYFEEALALMWDHLHNGTALPDSQVIRAIARGKQGETVPDLVRTTHLPPIAPTPAPADRIEFTGGTLTIPE
ncbi:MAG: D-(-)-3-hydroxybutyrate oligomer hydrolase [Proteobacteria bacterium]|nr:D-(-)-3-hydroxybutyrate oligomer hydrolase [Pseudomonadota bacterium]